MFDKELFYSLCNKYNVELSKEYDKPMMRTNIEVRELLIDDIENLVPRCRVYFRYENKEKEYQVSKIYSLEEVLVAC